jgi:hypothetical protein
MKVSVSVLLCRAFLVLAVLAPIAACLPEGGNLPTGGGGSGGGMASCGGSSGTSDLANWANVRDVIDNGCFGSDCHREGEREPILLSGGLTPLSDAAVYSKLTTYKAIKCNNRVLVKPCSPDESSFYKAQTGTCEGLGGIALAQMPFGCLPEFDNCTPANKLEGIRQWIANGAPPP